MDRQGKVTITPRFASAVSVVDDRVIGIDTKYRWGVYTPRGDVVVASEYHGIGACGALFLATRKDHAKVLFDRDGRTIGKTRFANVGTEGDGLVPVQAKADGPWGYVDLRGEMVIAPRFTGAFAFGRDHALAVENGALLVIDRSGKETARPRLGDVERASAFGKSGLAWAGEETSAVVALDGRIVVPNLLQGVDRLDEPIVWIRYAEPD